MHKFIVLIDDDEDDLELLQEAIRDLDGNATFMTFMDPIKGLTALCSPDVAPPDGIFLDINMPKMLGPDLLTILRSHPKFDRVPIAIISTSMTPSQQSDLINSGASFALQKPYKVDDYSKLIELVLGKRKNGA